LYEVVKGVHYQQAVGAVGTKGQMDDVPAQSQHSSASRLARHARREVADHHVRAQGAQAARVASCPAADIYEPLSGFDPQ